MRDTVINITDFESVEPTDADVLYGYELMTILKHWCEVALLTRRRRSDAGRSHAHAKTCTRSNLIRHF